MTGDLSFFLPMKLLYTPGWVWAKDWGEIGVVRILFDTELWGVSSSLTGGYAAGSIIGGGGGPADPIPEMISPNVSVARSRS
jgi:hypothetical protein